MKRQTRSVLLLAMIVILGAVALWKAGTFRRTQLAPVDTSGCDSALWSYVYHPRRLEVIEPCKTVEGVIVRSRHERDGDYHVLLDVDDKSLLNEENITRQHGALVLEPVCQFQPSQTDAIEPCRNYSGPFIQVPVGRRVRVTGPYVLDTEHGWREIHPVNSITPID